MKSTFLSGVLLAASLVLAGCATQSREYGAAPEIEVANLEALPAPQGMQVYRLGPQEKLEISVAGAESLSGTYLTDADGNLDYPLLGNVAVAGLSPTEAARVIGEGLRGDYLRDPQVRVIPAQMPSQSFSIGGQVNRPGAYPAQGKLSLVRAVNIAGGLSEYAKQDDVLIMRTVDGQQYIGAFNLQAIQRGNYEDPMLYPDDVIMVGDSPARRRLDTIVSLAGVLASTAVIFNQVIR